MDMELACILRRFADSSWELIARPSKSYLDDPDNKAALIDAIKQADSECGSCGCEFDPLYKKALVLLDA